MNSIKLIPLVGFLLLIMLISGRLIFLKRIGIRVSTKAKKLDGKNYFLYTLFIPIALLWLFEMVKSAFHLPVSILPELIIKQIVSFPFLQISGVILIVAALVLMLVVLLHFKDSLRFGLDKNNQGILVTGGIFSISRNPFFLSLDLYFLGTAFIFQSLFFAGFAVLSIISIHFFILKEEKFLQEIYGEDYKKYTERVRRYF